MFPNNQNFLQPLWHNGPCPGGFNYSFPNKNVDVFNNPAEQFGTTTGRYGVQHSSKPITTGTSVMGMKFDDGVIIAADTLISYGSTAKFEGIDRVFSINNKTILGVGGDYADFQYLKKYIDQKVVEDICYDDSMDMKPKSLFNWLTRILYNKRSRFQPLWLEIIVGGLEDDVPFLGHIDLRGKSYQGEIIATGMGRHLALPYLRGEVEHKQSLSMGEAEELIGNALEILWYRDCRACPEYKTAICTKDGTIVKGPFEVKQNWAMAETKMNVD